MKCHNCIYVSYVTHKSKAGLLIRMDAKCTYHLGIRSEKLMNPESGCDRYVTPEDWLAHLNRMTRGQHVNKV